MQSENFFEKVIGVEMGEGRGQEGMGLTVS